MVKRDKHLFMLLRVAFFTVVLLVSAAVQARTPYESTAHDRIVQTFRPELPALSDRLLPEEVLWMASPPGSRNELKLDPLPKRKEPKKPRQNSNVTKMRPVSSRPEPSVSPEVVWPRHSFSMLFGLEGNTLSNFAALIALEYTYRQAGNFEIGAQIQYEYGSQIEHSVKVMEVNYKEFPVFDGLSFRIGIGLGAWLYEDQGHWRGGGVGRLSMQWVLQISDLLSFYCSPLLGVGPSHIDWLFGGPTAKGVIVSAEYVQNGLSFRF